MRVEQGWHYVFDAYTRGGHQRRILEDRNRTTTGERASVTNSALGPSCLSGSGRPDHFGVPD